MAYELTGKIIVLNETQTFASGFTKREFVLETVSDKYPQQIKLEVVKDNCGKLDKYEVGDELTVSFDVRGNEHNGRYFVNLQAWKIERIGEREPQGARSPEYGKREAPRNQANDDFSDVPF